MARTESKSMTVSPIDEEFYTKKAELFGWDLLSSQEINSKESHQELIGDEVYSVTSSENYVKLTFKRDRDMENHDKIVELENEYWGELFLALQKTSYLPVRNLFLNFVIIVGIISFFAAGGFFIVAGLLAIAGWVMFVVKKSKRKNLAKDNVARIEEEVDKLF